MSVITFNPSAFSDQGFVRSSEVDALMETTLKRGVTAKQIQNSGSNIKTAQYSASTDLPTEKNKLQLARKEAAPNPWFPNSGGDANPRDYQLEERKKLMGPAFERINNVIKNSAYARSKSNSTVVDKALNAKRDIGDIEGATAAFTRDLSYYVPNRDGRGTITLTPTILLKDSKPEIGALALVHEATHATESAANPTYPQNKPFPIQSEVKAFVEQLKLYKELRPKLVDADGNPRKELNEFDKAFVKDTELLYRLQKSGGFAAIQKEIETWPSYQNLPGRKDKIYLPGGFTIPKIDLPDFKIPPGALPNL
jgi:hypothetical protein